MPAPRGARFQRAGSGSILAPRWCLQTGIPLLLLLLVSGCASPKAPPGPRPFDFQNDTFAYANGLVWVYHFDARSNWVHETREPEPDYTHHCFVVARSAKQFFQNATFDPGQPLAEADTYRKLIRRVIAVDPEHVLPATEKIAIPGYANLRAFSEGQEDLLKDECGGAWHSYFQRGNWRMVFPFSRRHQQSTAAQLAAEVKANRPPIVHVVRFPQLTINHAVLLFAAIETPAEIAFTIYDPNEPAHPRTLTYDRASRRFALPTTNYFPGGRVDVYEIYRNWRY